MFISQVLKTLIFVVFSGSALVTSRNGDVKPSGGMKIALR